MQTNDRAAKRICLGQFLRSRRERLLPKDFGFPGHGRRTPGLRRAEVAELARISADYYTWIEQDRNMNVSPDVLNALARSLKLNEAEQTHLFTLAGIETQRSIITENDAIHPTLAYLLADSEAACALTYDPWFNVVTSTSLARAVLEIGTNGRLASNVLYQLFAVPGQRSLWADWESEARMHLGMFRQSLAKSPDSSDGARLLDALMSLSDFAPMWASYEVRLRPSPDEYFRTEPWLLNHPEVGALRLHRIALTVPTQRDLTVLFYSPAENDTLLKLRELHHRCKMRSHLFLASA